MASKKSDSTDDDITTSDQWSAQADLYSNQATRLTELHGADLVTILKDDILKANTILDVGCGTGAFARAYMRQFPKGVPGQTLILSDISEGMLNKAKETIIIPPASGFQTKLIFQIENGTKLDGIPDSSIDIVVSLFGVFLIPDTKAALQAIGRVLKDGKGVFANASWMFDVSEYFTSKGFGVSLQDAFKLPNDVIRGNTDSTPQEEDGGMPDVTKWSTIENIQGLLKEYSNDVRCYPAIHNTVWDFDTLWSMMCQHHMSAIPKATEEKVMKAKRALEEFIAQGGGKESTSLTGPLMLSTASILTIVR